MPLRWFCWSAVAHDALPPAGGAGPEGDALPAPPRAGLPARSGSARGRAGSFTPVPEASPLAPEASSSRRKPSRFRGKLRADAGDLPDGAEPLRGRRGPSADAAAPSPRLVSRFPPTIRPLKAAPGARRRPRRPTTDLDQPPPPRPGPAPSSAGRRPPFSHLLAPASRRAPPPAQSVAALRKRQRKVAALLRDGSPSATAAALFPRFTCPARVPARRLPCHARAARPAAAPRGINRSPREATGHLRTSLLPCCASDVSPNRHHRRPECGR
jgi:hypothetical protein